MKLLAIFFFLLLFFGGLMDVAAQTGGMLTVRAGKTKKFEGGRIKVGFVEVVEDSRCPTGVDCIWAGNARIKITVSRGRRPAKTFELNTNIGDKSAECHGVTVSLNSLSPYPSANAPIAASDYIANIEVGTAPKNPPK